MLEIKIKLQKHRILSICADTEGMADLLSSVKYAASTQRDVMFTSEDWHGELSAVSMTKSEGHLCTRFDLFPTPHNDNEHSEIRYSDDGVDCYTASIIATTSWMTRFAEQIQQLLHSTEIECYFTITSKIESQTSGETPSPYEDIILFVKKAALP